MKNFPWLLAWIFWGIGFAVIEITALITKSGGTLSETIWRLFNVRRLNQFKWSFRWLGLAIFMIWLTFHFLVRV